MSICDLFRNTDKTPMTLSLPLGFENKFCFIKDFKKIYLFHVYPMFKRHSISCFVLDGELVGIIYLRANFSFLFTEK